MTNELVTGLNVSPTSLMVMEMDGIIDMYPAGPEQDAAMQYLQLVANNVEEDRRQAADSLAKAFQYDDTHYHLTQVCLWRKAKFYEAAIEAIDNLGFPQQVVLFADGNNPMVCALAKRHPYVQFFCTDLDARVMEQKQAFAKQLGLDNVRCTALDVSKPGFMDNLLAIGFNPSKSAYAQAEGLLYYISEEAERNLFSEFLIDEYTRILLVDVFSYEAIHGFTEIGRAYRDFCQMAKEALHLPQELRLHRNGDFESKYGKLYDCLEVRRQLGQPVSESCDYKLEEYLQPEFTLRLYQISF